MGSLDFHFYNLHLTFLQNFQFLILSSMCLGEEDMVILKSVPDISDVRSSCGLTAVFLGVFIGISFSLCGHCTYKVTCRNYSRPKPVFSFS